MLSDERLEELIRSLDRFAQSWNVATADSLADALAALREYQSLRRRDAAIEKALRESAPASFLAAEPTIGEQIEIVVYDADNERDKEVRAPTFSEALSALAAGLEGEGK